MMTKGRGEILEPSEYNHFTVNLIKPINLGISAKEAYTKFAQKISQENTGRENFVNDLEWAVFEDYEELKHIKNKYPKSIMTGSGSTYYSLEEKFEEETNFWVKNNLETINYGVQII